jgi:hypothetical protein
MAFSCRESRESLVVSCSNETRLELCVPPKEWTMTRYTRYEQYWKGKILEFHPLNDLPSNKQCYVLKKEALAFALKYHGGEERLEAAKKVKAERQAKAQQTRLNNAAKRDEDAKKMLQAVGIDLASGFHNELRTCRGDNAVKALYSFVNLGRVQPVALIQEFCKVRFLVSYTPYVKDVEELNRVLGYDGAKALDQAGTHLEALTLRGLPGGCFPGWWPWLEWSPDVHKFALSSFKEQVRAWMLVAYRSNDGMYSPMILEAVIKALSKTVVLPARRMKNKASKTKALVVV